MKTTNYEISKKLAEIGFRAECSYFYFHSDNNDYEASYLEAFGYDKISDCDIEDKYYPSYNLETLLDVLPKSLKSKLELRIWYDKKSTYIGYQNFEGFDKALNLKQQENESLADTAGRLIILLHEKNLIKF
jgi:hypothetical protein